MATTIAKEGNEVHVKPKGKGKRAWILSRAEYDEMVRAIMVFGAEEKNGAIAVAIDNETISVTKLLADDNAEPAKK